MAQANINRECVCSVGSLCFYALKAQKKYCDQCMAKAHKAILNQIKTKFHWNAESFIPQ